MRGGLHGVEIEIDVGQRLDGGEDDGEVVGTTAGHHRVGGDPLDGGLALAGRQDADQLARITIGPAQEFAHRRLGGRHDRQSVRPAALLVVLVDRVPGALELEDGGGGPALAHARVTAFSTDSMASSALRITSSSWMPPSGWGTSASGRSAMPRLAASRRASASNSNVPMVAVGTPRCSSMIEPWILHDVQDPQSALPTSARSHWESAARASADGGRATGFSRLTTSPAP